MRCEFNAKTPRHAFVRVGMLLSVSAAVSAMLVERCWAEPADEFWAFYEKYPQYQDFFPFGVYGGGPFLEAMAFQDCSPVMASQMTWDAFSAHPINFLWRGQFGDDAFNEQVFGEELPNRGIRVAPDVAHWVGYKSRTRSGGPFQKYMDRQEPLNEAELTIYEKEFGLERLNILSRLAGDYPESIVGYVIGDEPHYMPPIVAAARAIENYTKPRA